MAALLHALSYFAHEALVSLWRSRLMNALSVGTIAVSLFVCGAFLTVAANLGAVIERFSSRVQVVFYLRDDVEPRIRQAFVERLRDDPAVAELRTVERAEALRSFRQMFRDLGTLPDDLGENPFPASVEATLREAHRSPDDVRRLVSAFSTAPGVEDVQYDLLWIERLATGVRLLRGLGLLLGGILVAAGVFTISNVIRLTVYARQDELDIMRLVGAAPAYVKGPFVVEGMLQGLLGGALAVLVLWAAFHLLARDALAASTLLGHAVVFLPWRLCGALAVGGALLGLLGALVSLGRSRV